MKSQTHLNQALIITWTGSDYHSFGMLIKDVVHELLHQGGVEHPTDPLNTASDVSLEHTGKNEYITTSTTDKSNIYNNIMLYGLYKVDDKRVSEVRGLDQNATSVSPDQIKVVSTNIDQGKVNGEALK